MNPFPPASTAGGRPPRSPVKDWRFCPDDVVEVELDDDESVEVVEVVEVDVEASVGAAAAAVTTAEVAAGGGVEAVVEFEPPVTALLKASAAAWPVSVEAACSPVLQASMAATAKLSQ